MTDLHPHAGAERSAAPDPPAPIGIVAIGRNEGAHLQRCLRSVVRPDTLVVYVDSGSTDGSVAMAEAMGVEVVRLDLSTPFTAARARNAGWRRLVELRPDLRYVQFVDGDCELVPDWIDRARATLDADAGLVAVFGQRAELHPDASVYNAICDLEWDTPVGDGSAFGGEVMMRLDALRAVGGYDDAVVASEDRELWMRLRHAGGRTLRVPGIMSRHDARMTRFKQFWKRQERTGHAYGQLATMHRGDRADRHHDASQRRAVIWGAAIPAVLLATAWPTWGLSLLGFGGYALPAWRAYRYGKSRGWPERPSRWFGVLCTVGKFPEAIGVARWHWRRLTGRKLTLIEYKGPAVGDRPAAA